MIFIAIGLCSLLDREAARECGEIHDIILAMAAEHSFEDHFERKDATVRATYDALLRVARGFGHVVEEPKKTSIHLVADTAFAGVVTRRSKLVLTIKSPTEIKNPRIAWLRRAYEISRA